MLRHISSPLDDVEPARRAITLRDLLTSRLGIGAVMAPPGTFPIQAALENGGLAPGPNPPTTPPDAWMARLAGLPLIRQPGDAWMYHTSSDVLGVLIARVCAQSLAEVLRRRLFEPLGMIDTGFHVRPDQLDRFTTSYRGDLATGASAVHDRAASGRWSSPPAFASGGGGLVSTADDYLAFCRMLLARGAYPGGQILSPESVDLMTSDHLTPAQRAEAPVFFAADRSWGFGMAVTIAPDEFGGAPGRFGWDGGVGTSAYSDPRADFVGILLTQRMLTSPAPPLAFRDFWMNAYQSLRDETHPHAA